jgi:hypothetical protein
MPKQKKIWIIPTPNKEGPFIRVPADTLQKGGNLQRLRTHTNELRKTTSDTEPTTPKKKP